MDWSRLSMKKHENLAFFGLFWHFLTLPIHVQSMCTWILTWILGKINPTPVHEDFFPQSMYSLEKWVFLSQNPCTVHVTKNYKILVSIQVGLKDLFDHNLNTGKVERNFCLNTASIQVGIFFTSGPLSTSLCRKFFFGPQSQFSLWEAHEGPCTSWPVSA